MGLKLIPPADCGPGLHVPIHQASLFFRPNRIVERVGKELVASHLRRQKPSRSKHRAGRQKQEVQLEVPVKLRMGSGFEGIKAHLCLAPRGAGTGGLLGVAAIGFDAARSHGGRLAQGHGGASL